MPKIQQRNSKERECSATPKKIREMRGLLIAHMIWLQHAQTLENNKALWKGRFGFHFDIPREDFLRNSRTINIKKGAATSSFHYVTDFDPNRITHGLKINM